MFGLMFRGEMPNAVENELEQFMSRLRALWLTEHNESGGHDNITARSITLSRSAMGDSAALVSAGSASFEGSGSFGENVTVNAGTASELELGTLPGFSTVRAVTGIEMRSEGTPDPSSHWRIGTFTSSSDERELLIQDLRDGTDPYTFRVYYNAGATSYILHPESSVSMQLGENSPGRRFSEVNSALVRATTSLVIGTSVIRSGTGDPETVVTGNVGDLFLRTDGGAGTTLYVKESGTGNTGWDGK